jgi:4-diphosphocytidyl-2-C-methyl-D-erythritol kinase
MRVRAFAKINLSLRVLGARRDGYHELRTIFQSIALHDTLAVRRTRSAFALTCDDPRCPVDRTNLVWRAASQMWKAAGRRGAPTGVAIHLVKRIPMNAGLGGGSSDGAAAVRALARLWRVGADDSRRVAASLGADVPFFLEGGTVLGLERGDLLFPLPDRPAAWVVLVVPPVGVSTREAFAWWDRAKRTRIGVASRSARQNDLEAIVGTRHPEIARAVAALRKMRATDAGMTGSGSAVFGLFAARRPAARAAAAVGRRGWPAMLTRTLGRRAYLRLAGP